jgi:hypothetical protein
MGASVICSISLAQDRVVVNHYRLAAALLVSRHDLVSFRDDDAKQIDGEPGDLKDRGEREHG